MHFDVHSFWQTAIVIDWNKSCDLLQPITITVCKKQIKIELKIERVYSWCHRTQILEQSWHVFWWYFCKFSSTVIKISRKIIKEVQKQTSWLSKALYISLFLKINKMFAFALLLLVIIKSRFPRENSVKYCDSGNFVCLVHGYKLWYSI